MEKKESVEITYEATERMIDHLDYEVVELNGHIVFYNEGNIVSNYGQLEEALTSIGFTNIARSPLQHHKKDSLLV